MTAPHRQTRLDKVSPKSLGPCKGELVFIRLLLQEVRVSGLRKLEM